MTIQDISKIKVGSYISYRYILINKDHKKEYDSLYTCSSCKKASNVFIVIDPIDSNSLTLYTRSVCCQNLVTFRNNSQNKTYEVFIRDDIPYIII